MFKQSDLDKVKRSVLRKYDIAAGVALDGIEIRLSDQCETACVVGQMDAKGVLQVKEILVNPTFFEKLTFAERVFVLAHETFHIALRHFARSMEMPEKDAMRKYKEYCEKETDEAKRQFMKAQYLNRYHEIWNIATDACINAFLKKDGLSFPENVMDPKTGKKMTFVDMKEGLYQSAEKIYKYLVQKEEQKWNQPQEQHSNQPANSSSESNSSNSGSQSGTTSIDDVLSKDYVGIDSHEQWSGDENNSSKSTFEEDSEETKEDTSEGDLFEQIEKARKKDNSKKESVSDTLSRIREEAGNLDFEKAKPIISWKTLLVGYLEKTEEVWGKRRASRYNPNARIEERTFEKLPNVEVILDTSGSISSTLLKGFLLQLVPIFQTLYGEEVSIKVGCFGSFFSGFTPIRTMQDIKNYQPVNGGGTNFELAATSFTPDPGRTTTKIVFTDGGMGIPQKTKVDNIIWIVFGNQVLFQPVSGRVIRVSDKDFDSMMKEGQNFIAEDESSIGRHR